MVGQRVDGSIQGELTPVSAKVYHKVANGEWCASEDWQAGKWNERRRKQFTNAVLLFTCNYVNSLAPFFAQCHCVWTAHKGSLLPGVHGRRSQASSSEAHHRSSPLKFSTEAMGGSLQITAEAPNEGSLHSMEAHKRSKNSSIRRLHSDGATPLRNRPVSLQQSQRIEDRRRKHWISFTTMCAMPSGIQLGLVLGWQSASAAHRMPWRGHGYDQKHTAQSSRCAFQCTLLDASVGLRREREAESSESEIETN